MRQSQKTEQQADRLSRIGLENRKYTRARSTGYGEGKGMSVTIQDLVLDRNNLNQAYLRVKRNKGGPLSPLLANIYLNELDEELTRRGHHFVRYADDCNIYVKSQRAGERVMRSITQFLEKRLKVKVNPDKTKVGSPLRLKFLGFSLGVDHNGAYARPAKQSQQRVKKALKLLTKRNRGISLTRMFEEIHRKMRGWLQYLLNWETN